jgi:uncharacterized membrane protein YgcG
VNDDLTRTVYDAYDCLLSPDTSGKGSLQESKLEEMQTSQKPDVLRFVEPKFWFNDPTILETMIVFSLWQNSVSVTLMLYFVEFEVNAGFHTCYWESRTILGTLTMDVAMIVGTLLVCAFGVVPVYVLLSLSAHHNDKMQKKKKKPHGHGHGGHDDHGGGGHGGGGHGGGGHGGGGHGGGGHDKKSEHGSEHGSDHGSDSQTNEKKEGTSKTKVAPEGGGELSSWGRTA